MRSVFWPVITILTRNVSSTQKISCFVFGILSTLLLAMLKLDFDEMPVPINVHSHQWLIKTSTLHPSSEHQTKLNRCTSSNVSQFMVFASLAIETDADQVEIVINETTKRGIQLPLPIVLLSNLTGKTFGTSHSNVRFLDLEQVECFANSFGAKSMCLPVLILRLFEDYSSIIWAESISRHQADLLILFKLFGMKGSPVETKFFGYFSNRTLHIRTDDMVGGFLGFRKPKTIRLMSAAKFIISPNIHFFYKVLLPWLECSQAGRCFLPSDYLKQKCHADQTQESIKCAGELVLSILLYRYGTKRPASVCVCESSASQKNCIPYGRKDKLDFTKKASTISQSNPIILRDWPRLDERFAEQIIISVPLHGPNNQIICLLHAAALAKHYGFKWLAPPIISHYIAEHVDSKPSIIYPEELLSPRLLYQQALLCDEKSNWTSLLPKVDFIDISRNITENVSLYSKEDVPLGELNNFSDHMKNFFAHSGLSLALHSNSTMRRITCSLSRLKECIQRSIKAGRSIIYEMPYRICLRGVPCSGFLPLWNSAPFRMPGFVLSRRHLPRSTDCLAIQFRFSDRLVNDGVISAGNVTQDKLLDSNVWELMGVPPPAQRVGRFANSSLREFILEVGKTAAAARKRLFVMMAYYEPVFTWLDSLEGVDSINKMDLEGLTGLQTTILDMVMAAGCDFIAVNRYRSSVGGNVISMHAGEGVSYINLASSRGF